MIETWRVVPGYENYEISVDTKEGKCRNIKRGKELSSKPDKWHNRIYWNLWKNGAQERQQAARWIALTFPELVQNEYFDGAEIDHVDTDRLNNHPSNLRWVTSKENCNNPLTKERMIAVLDRVRPNVWKTDNEEAKQKMLAGLKNHMKNHMVSEETKNKIRLAMLKNPTNTKQVRQYDLTGTLLYTYTSGEEASRTTGIPVCLIRDCCNGRQKTTRGYVFKYV